MYSKVLVANRGAIARRIIRACNELDVASVAVYSDPDGGAPHLAEATETVRLAGERARDTYLNREALLDAVRASGADALHPGYGFLAENGSFAREVIEAGAVFIGPDPRWLDAMGDKIRARRLAEQHGLPVFGGSEALDDVDRARAVADRIGYPVMLKPSAGGGGIGMRVVRDEGELASAMTRAREIARRSFSDDALFLERWIDTGRHIEFQLLGDGRGGAVHLHERECSVQRRHQKVLEESPAPGIDRAELAAMAERAAAFAAKVGYDSVGTLETLRAGAGDYGFLEMNTRIQVEHAVTEVVTGVDLLVAQMRLAAGESLAEAIGLSSGAGELTPPPLDGHALEVRIYAEHPRTQLPSTGRLAVFRPPALYGVRVDTGYQAGQAVTPFYDPMLAKVIGHGTTREQAIGRVLVALKAFQIEGVDTNIPLLSALLGNEHFLAGAIDTGMLPRILANGF